MASPANAAAITNALFDIQEADESRFPPIDHMKLQKLLYYSHAWWLAGHDDGLFPEDVEAWAWGPVVRNIYIQFHEFGREPVGEKRAVELIRVGEGPLKYQFREPDPVPEEVRKFLVSIWKTHKQFTGIQLSNATHMSGEPWAIVREQYGSLEGKPKIPNELIRDVFRAKLTA